jgi:hypothetical protein
MFALHVFAMLFSLTVVSLADKEALAWVRGKKTVLSPRRVAIFHWLTWAGLATLLISGIWLALPQLGYLLSQPLFVMKMLFVAVLLVNAVLIGRFSHTATARTFSTLTWDEALPLFTSGAVSFFAWIGAVVLALIIFG